MAVQLKGQGIRTGDIIQSVDGLSTETLETDEIKSLFMGEIDPRLAL